jgi:hypothetical protein
MGAAGCNLPQRAWWRVSRGCGLRKLANKPHGKALHPNSWDKEDHCRGQVEQSESPNQSQQSKSENVRHETAVAARAGAGATAPTINRPNAARSASGASTTGLFNKARSVGESPAEFRDNLETHAER